MSRGKAEMEIRRLFREMGGKTDMDNSQQVRVEEWGKKIR